MNTIAREVVFRWGASGRRLACSGALAGWALTAGLQAQDFAEPRTYLHFRSGEFDTAWGVHDFWGLSVGRNLNAHWGVELAGDAWERYLPLGEESVNAVIPQVRSRWPLWGDRLVPYVIAGVGPVFLQFNDRTPAGRGLDIDSEGWRLGAAAGGGIEYHINSNMAFVVEAKYAWVDAMEFSVNGREEEIDLSNALVSLGIRACFEEVPRREYAESAAAVPPRYYFLVNYGGSIATRRHFGGGIELDPEPSALGGIFNQNVGLGLGLNWGRHLGAEVVVDAEERRLIDRQLGNLGEYTVASIVPRVRVRAPQDGGRWVPYAVAGAGLAYGEYNDGTGVARVLGKGFYPVIEAGAGGEWFVARNVSFHVDALWSHTWGHEIEVNGATREGSLSTFQVHLGFHLYLIEGRSKGS